MMRKYAGYAILLSLAVTAAGAATVPAEELLSSGPDHVSEAGFPDDLLLSAEPGTEDVQEDALLLTEEQETETGSENAFSGEEDYGLLDPEAAIEENEIPDLTAPGIEEDTVDPEEPAAEDASSALGIENILFAHAEVIASSQVGASEQDLVDVMELVADETDHSKILGVVVTTYKGHQLTADKVYAITYWDAASRRWYDVSKDGKTRTLLPDGVHFIYGEIGWNLTNGRGTGGYYLDAESGEWAYYLTTGEAANEAYVNSILPDDLKEFPAAVFHGANVNPAKYCGYRKVNGKWYFLFQNGTIAKNRLVTNKGNVYSFDANGVCMGMIAKGQEGWIQRPNGYYWIQKNGTVLTKAGVQTLGGKRYFLYEKSGRRASGFVYYDKKMYYLSPKTGVLFTKWVTVDNKKYYFNPVSGAMEKGWRVIDGKTYFFNKQNGVLATGWQTIGEAKYYFGTDGAMFKGWQIAPGPNGEKEEIRLFDRAKGHLYADRWFTDSKNGNKRYYLKSDGSRQKGWLRKDGKDYFFNKQSGVLTTGWFTINNYKYYFGTDGAKRLGLQKIDNKIYYFLEKNNSGVMMTGWITVGSYRYFFKTDGSAATGLTTIGGNQYYFDDNGRLLKDRKIKINGWYYTISTSGVASRVSEAQDLAMKRLDEVGWSLRNAYNWSVGLTYDRSTSETAPAGYKEADWFAIYGFKYHSGNCYMYACTFYQMAIALGYDAHFVKGYVPSASRGMVTHGWVEVVINGTTYICDPDFEYDDGVNGYMIYYGKPGTWRYSNYRRVN